MKKNITVEEFEKRFGEVESELRFKIEDLYPNKVGGIDYCAVGGTLKEVFENDEYIASRSQYIQMDEQPIGLLDEDNIGSENVYFSIFELYQQSSFDENDWKDGK